MLSSLCVCSEVNIYLILEKYSLDHFSQENLPCVTRSDVADLNVPDRSLLLILVDFRMGSTASIVHHKVLQMLIDYIT